MTVLRFMMTYYANHSLTEAIQKYLPTNMSYYKIVHWSVFAFIMRLLLLKKINMSSNMSRLTWKLKKKNLEYNKTKMRERI